MCIADEEDDSFFRRLEEEYELELDTYPMVRVTASDKTQEKESAFEGSPAQGQHIGISESTYHILKKQRDKEYKEQPLGLDEAGEEIYIVHQQDKSMKAMPTDWRDSRKRPFLHIGQPCEWYNSLKPEIVFPPRKIKGEEIASLTGCFRQGWIENLIVFSDAYFAEAQEMWKFTNIYSGKKIENEEERILDVTIRQGPTKLVLIRAQETDIAALEKEMEKFRANHSYDERFDSEVLSCYSKRAAVDDLKTERMMKIVVNLFVMAVLIMTGIFLLCVKVFSETEEKRRRAVFLECMGMKEKERRSLLRKEMNLFYLMPGAVSLAVTAVFTAATFRARMYTANDMESYLWMAVWVWTGYLLIWLGIIRILGRVSIVKSER